MQVYIAVLCCKLLVRGGVAQNKYLDLCGPRIAMAAGTTEFTPVALCCRRDMAALEKRTAAVDLSEACAACARPLAAPSPPAAGPSGGALPPCLLFPTGKVNPV